MAKSLAFDLNKLLGKVKLMVNRHHHHLQLNASNFVTELLGGGKNQNCPLPGKYLINILICLTVGEIHRANANTELLTLYYYVVKFNDSSP